MNKGLMSLRGYQRGGPVSLGGGLAALLSRKFGRGASRLKPLFFGERSETGYVPGASEAIYNAVKPWAGADIDVFGALLRIARGDPGSPREGDELTPDAQEDAWATYLGLPQQHGTYKEAEYRPSKGSGEDIRYLDFADPNLILDELVEQHGWYLDPLTDPYTANRGELARPSTFSAPWVYRQEGQERPNAIRDVVRMLEDKSFDKDYLQGPYGPSPLGGREEEGAPFQRYSDLMGTYTLDKGEDERGPYISYYDKYDITQALPARVSKVGQPFDVYGRMYYDPETYEYRGSNE